MARVREVLRIRLEASPDTSKAEISEHEGDGPFPHLVARYFHGPVQRRRIVGVLDGPPTTSLVARFVNEVLPRYGADVHLPADLVHFGTAASDKVVQAAARRRRAPIAVRPFSDYQAVWDASGYLTAQTLRLTRDPQYPVGLYIDKRWTSIASGGAQLRKEVLSAAVSALTSDRARFRAISKVAQGRA